MIYVPSFNDYLANNADRLTKALELSSGHRYKFKTIVRTFFIADYGYHHNEEAIRQILAGECLPLEVNLNKYIEMIEY